MKNIAVFGGTFNPFHKGHKNLISQASKALKFDEIIIIPSKIPPHKKAECLADKNDRIRMIELSLENNSIDCDNIIISDIELNRKGKSYSVETLKSLKEIYPDAEYKLHFVMGSDMLLYFKKWYEYRKLLGLCTLVCLSRCDEDTGKLKACADELEALGGEVIIVPIKPFEISSTDIRKAFKLKDYEKLTCYLDKKVVEYILEKNLYIEDFDSINYDKKIKFFKSVLKNRLSKKRYHHSVCVANEAKALAKENGYNERQSYLAGLIHDVCKEDSTENQLELMSRAKTYIDDTEKSAKVLYHGIAGSVFIEEELGICDEDVQNAVRYHTVAREGMSPLEKIVYLADLVSEDRTYSDVKRYRKLAHKDLDIGMLEALKYSIKDTVDNECEIVGSTLLAYNEYIRKLKNKK